MQIYDRRGSGPGELVSSPGKLRVIGDTLFAFDRNGVLVFASDLNHLATAVIPFVPRGLVVLSDDRIVANYPVVAGGVANAVHHIGKDGRVRRSLIRYPRSRRALGRIAQAGSGGRSCGTEGATFPVLALAWVLLARLSGALLPEPAIAGRTFRVWAPLHLSSLLLTAVFTGGIDEGLGWRGFLLPRLQEAAGSNLVARLRRRFSSGECHLSSPLMLVVFVL